MSDFYPHFVQPPKGNTITTNRITEKHLTTAKIQGTTQQTEPPTSNWAVAAVTLLLLGFFAIFLGLFIPSVILYTTILGGSLILAANTLATLSLRDLL